MRICQWVNDYAANSKTAKETSQELKPQWSGYLVVDGKTIKVKGKRNCLIIGVDYTGDIPLTEYEIGPENKTAYVRFFRNLKELNYQIKGLVSDGREDIYQAAKLFYSSFHYQTCLKHFMRNIDRSFSYLTIKRKKLDSKFEKELKFRNEIYQLIYAQNYDNFLNQYYSLQRKKRYAQSPYCYKMWGKIQVNLHPIVARYFDRQLELTNNQAESFIKQINRRLKLIEGFQSSRTAECYLRLLIMYLRFKPYTDAKRTNKRRNGKSRLELVGVKTENIDWLKFSQKTKRD